MNLEEISNQIQKLSQEKKFPEIYIAIQQWAWKEMQPKTIIPGQENLMFFLSFILEGSIVILWELYGIKVEGIDIQWIQNLNIEKIKVNWSQINNVIGYNLGDILTQVKNIGIYAHISDAIAYNNWGAALHEIGKLNQDEKTLKSACEKYEEAIKIDSNNVKAYFKWGNALSEIGKLNQDTKTLESACEKYKEAIKIDSNNVNAYFNWGNELSEIGRLNQDTKTLESACEKYKEAIKIDSKNVKAYIEWGNALFEIGELNQDTKILESACEKYKRATEIDSNCVFAYSNWGNVLSAIGEQNQDIEKLKSACEKYKKATKIDSNNVNAYYNWGSALYKIRELNRNINSLKEACEKYKKVIEINYNYPEAHSNWANVLRGFAEMTREVSYLEEGTIKFETAIELFKKQNHPHKYNYSITYHNYGKALLEKASYKKYESNKQELWKQAAECFEKSLEIDFEREWSYETYNELIGLYIFKLKDPDNANRIIESYSNAMPHNPNHVYYRGILHLQRNELGLAKKNFEKAYHLNPIADDAKYQLARIYEMEKNYDKAIEHCKDILRIGTSAEYIKREVPKLNYLILYARCLDKIDDDEKIDEVIDYAEEVIKQHPTKAKGYYSFYVGLVKCFDWEEFEKMQKELGTLYGTCKDEIKKMKEDPESLKHEKEGMLVEVEKLDELRLWLSKEEGKKEKAQEINEVLERIEHELGEAIEIFTNKKCSPKDFVTDILTRIKKIKKEISEEDGNIDEIYERIISILLDTLNYIEISQADKENSKLLKYVEAEQCYLLSKTKERIVVGEMLKDFIESRGSREFEDYSMPAIGFARALEDEFIDWFEKILKIKKPDTLIENFKKKYKDNPTYKKMRGFNFGSIEYLFRRNTIYIDLYNELKKREDESQECQDLFTQQYIDSFKTVREVRNHAAHLKVTKEDINKEVEILFKKFSPTKKVGLLIQLLKAKNV